MNSDLIRGNWMILKGRIKESWGRMIGDEITIAAGKNLQLAGRVTVRYSNSTDLQDDPSKASVPMHGN